MRSVLLDATAVSLRLGQSRALENRQAQAGRRISLKVVVLPGARRGENPDPLFYLQSPV